MTKDGRLSNRDMVTLNNAWNILSRWTEIAEDDNSTNEWLYDMAMNAVAGLCEFINNYEG